MFNKILEKINSSWLFFITSLFLCVVLTLIKPDCTLEVFNSFWQLILNIAPTMCLVFILIYLVNLFLDYKKISKYVGQKSGIVGWLTAIGGGIISTGPIYLWYPFLSDLKAKKMRVALISTFLYNRSIKLPLAPIFIYLFGFPLLLILMVLTIIFSIINGYVLELILKE